MKTGTIYVIEWPPHGPGLSVSNLMRIHGIRSAGLKPRKSGEFEFHFMTEGSMTFQVDEKPWLLSEGELAIFSPEQTYGIHPWEDSRATAYHGHFMLGASKFDVIRGDFRAWVRLRMQFDRQSQAFSRTLCLPDRFSVRDCTGLLRGLTDVMAIQRERTPGYALAAEGRFLCVLQAISAEAIAECAGGEGKARFSRAQVHVGRALEFIRRNLTRPLSLAEVAGHVRVNEAYLARIFRMHTGETVGTTITRCKIARAKERLLSESRSIKEISAELGFHDPLYFSRQFRKVEGVSPSEFLLRRGP